MPDRLQEMQKSLKVIEQGIGGLSPGGITAAILGTNTVDKTPIPAAVTNTLILAANAARKSCLVTNVQPSVTPATLYLSLSATATLGSAIVLEPGDHYIMTEVVYLGDIHGIWSSAVGQANVAEIV